MLLFVVFLAVAVPLYAAMHAYAYRKIIRAFPKPRGLKPVLVSALALLFMAPFLGRLFDHDGHVWLARAINCPAYLWTAWIFWFCTAGLVLDLGTMIIRALRPHAAIPSSVVDPSGTRMARRKLGMIAVLLVVATVWGSIEAAHPRVRPMTVRTSRLAPGTPPLRIIHISDVHLSAFRGPQWSHYLAGRVAALKPDLLLSTGDFIDSSIHNIGDQADDWAFIHPPFGKYAVLGNHEYYAGLDNAVAFHQKMGFRLLRGKGVDIGTGLRLYGIDDSTGLRLKVPCFNNESALKKTADPGRFIILLKHQPLLSPNSLDFYDLQLSGHTHGGQIFPFHLLVGLFYPLKGGLRSVGERSQLYPNHGAGTWGPPFRLFAPPEIAVITLLPDDAAPHLQ